MIKTLERLKSEVIKLSKSLWITPSLSEIATPKRANSNRKRIRDNQSVYNRTRDFCKFGNIFYSINFYLLIRKLKNYNSAN